MLLSKKTYFINLSCFLATPLYFFLHLAIDHDSLLIFAILFIFLQGRSVAVPRVRGRQHDQEVRIQLADISSGCVTAGNSLCISFIINKFLFHNVIFYVVEVKLCIPTLKVCISLVLSNVSVLQKKIRYLKLDALYKIYYYLLWIRWTPI